MKISIGDLIDRYSICKLKTERLGVDISQEINQLYNEINHYPNVDGDIQALYDVNGKIWDLEADIRKGNEDILGLEEIGRRALQIRDLNSVRVSIKNQINSRFNEGFVEIKMNHGSEKMPSVIVSLTTVPERLMNPADTGIKLVLQTLCEQDDTDYEVHFNIPHTYGITKIPYEIPSWLDEYKLKYPHLKVFRMEDMGPPTKFVPTLNRVSDPETILVVVDDDLIYHREMVSEHRKYQNILPNSVLCYDGRGCTEAKYHDLRDSWILCVTEPRETHNIQHYKSASYKKKLFDQDFYDFYFGKTFSDDVLVSRFARDKQIKMFVIPYEKDNHLFETAELWHKNQGVETFPVLKHAHSIMHTGCNHPDMLNIQPRFYEPQDIGKR